MRGSRRDSEGIYAGRVAILIDPAVWPAHGTTFAHLVSDESLAELHAFAEAAGLNRRAFDQDHYDVPAERREALIALGAQPVPAKELISRLRASGLRIPARDRAPALLATLRRCWSAALAALPGRQEAATRALGEELLQRWSEEHRAYHDLRHLRDVLAALECLRAPGPVPAPVLLAAWFHDAIYDGVAGSDEERSAELATARLLAAGAPEPLVDETTRLVLLTRSHDPGPTDHHGQLLCDADLAVLGRAPAGYARYLSDVRTEYAHVPEPDFISGRIAVVHRLLALDPIYRTHAARQLWEDRARRNLRSELELLGT